MATRTSNSRAAAEGATGGPDKHALGFPRSEFVQSLERGLAVIRSFSEQHPTRTLSEVAETVGLTRAAARRFLLTLQALGYVENNGRYFRLRPQTLELGYAYLASTPWWRHAQRIVERLGTQLRQACAVGVLERGEAAYVAYASGVPSVQVVRSVGTRLPAYATAIGRVLLAGLPQEKVDAYLKQVRLVRLTPFTDTSREALKTAVARARADGYAIVEQQLDIGLYSIGVPIFDRGRSVAAAISVGVRDPYLKAADMKRKYLTPLLRASKEITSALPT